jgi:hypothetical protein
MKMQLESPVPSVYPLAGRAPAWCDELIGRAMAKQPADRFASAEEFRAALATRVTAEGPETVDPKATRIAPAPVKATRLAAPAPVSREVSARISPALFSRRVLVGAAIVIALAAAAPFVWRKAFPPAQEVQTTNSAPVRTVGGGVSQPVAPPQPVVPPRMPDPSKPVSPKPVSPKPLNPPAITPPPVTPGPGPGVTKPPVFAAPPPPVSRTTAYPDPVEFARVALLELDGSKSRERDAVLRFEGSALVVRDAKSGEMLRRLPYASIESAIYSQSKQPRWKTAGAATILGGVFAAPVFFLKSTKHWLTIEGSSAVLVLRLDKNNHQLVVPELQMRSGVKVSK